jgi:RNA polymerase sigma factor for flagellar operon FliA
MSTADVLRYGGDRMSEQREYESKTSEELLQEYAKTKNHKIKQELALRYIHIVRSIAMQMRGVYLSFAQIDDIINEGIIAIMAAIDKFDVDKNIKFETYISKRIRGLIIDIARKQDWVPRSIRKQAKDIDEANTVLYSQLGRFPTEQEVADYMQISIEKYKEGLMKTNVYNLLSLEKVLEEDSGNRMREQLVSGGSDSLPEYCLQNKETAQILKQGLETLRENEQMVVSLYYVKELSMREIATVLKVSEPRVSQIHSNAIRKLRIYMKKFMSQND